MEIKLYPLHQDWITQLDQNQYEVSFDFSVGNFKQILLKVSQFQNDFIDSFWNWLTFLHYKCFNSIVHWGSLLVIVARFAPVRLFVRREIICNYIHFISKWKNVGLLLSALLCKIISLFCFTCSFFECKLNDQTSENTSSMV